MNLPLTTKNITFLKDLNPKIKIDSKSGWKYHHSDCLWSGEIWFFIRIIRDDKICLMTPVFINTRSGVTLNLSNPFLVNNKSNTDLIYNFIMSQWDNSGYYFKAKSISSFAIHYKEVKLS